MDTHNHAHSIIHGAEAAASHMEHQYIGTGHLLLGILRMSNDDLAGATLRRLFQRNNRYVTQRQQEDLITSQMGCGHRTAGFERRLTSEVQVVLSYPNGSGPDTDSQVVSFSTIHILFGVAACVDDTFGMSIGADVLRQINTTYDMVVDTAAELLDGPGGGRYKTDYLGPGVMPNATLVRSIGCSMHSVVKDHLGQVRQDELVAARRAAKKHSNAGWTTKGLTYMSTA